jgi:UDP-glucose 4-epimerase
MATFEPSTQTSRGDKTALVTGATGFLGRHVARDLRERGWHVVGLGTRPPENAPLDVLDEYHSLRLPAPRLAELTTAVAPDVCIHCAGRASVDSSIDDPSGDLQASVLVTAGLLEALRSTAPHCRLVYASSAAVYGEPLSLPVSEDQPLAPISPYGYHRQLCEGLCHEYAQVYGLRITVARIFSAYGPGLRRQVLWDICRRALTDRELVLRGTGDETRDFIHGHDVGRALVHLAMEADGRGECINVASGHGTRIRELAELALGHLNGGTPLRFSGESHTGNPTHWQASVSRLTDLGFSPRVPLGAGVAAYADWSRAEMRGW